MKPGHTDDGGVAAAQRVGQRHHPVGGHAGVGRKAAVMGHAEVVALHQHPLAGGEVRTRALLDGAGQLDARTSGNDRATRLPGRVTMASLKLMADHSTRDQHFARREVVLAESSTTAGRMTSPVFESR